MPTIYITSGFAPLPLEAFLRGNELGLINSFLGNQLHFKEFLLNKFFTGPNLKIKTSLKLVLTIGRE